MEIFFFLFFFLSPYANPLVRLGSGGRRVFPRPESASTDTVHVPLFSSSSSSSSFFSPSCRSIVFVLQLLFSAQKGAHASITSFLMAVSIELDQTSVFPPPIQTLVVSFWEDERQLQEGAAKRWKKRSSKSGRKKESQNEEIDKGNGIEKKPFSTAGEKREPDQSGSRSPSSPRPTG